MIAGWGENVYVKIPVSTTAGESMAPLVRELSENGVKVNVTAVFTTAQVELLTEAVKDGAPSYISVFAGRIADAGIDPVPIMGRAVDIMVQAPRSELIWASPREILNVVQADQVGCHIITLTNDLLKSSICSARICCSTRSRRCRCSGVTPSRRVSRSDPMRFRQMIPALPRPASGGRHAA